MTKHSQSRMAAADNDLAIPNGRTITENSSLTALSDSVEAPDISSPFQSCLSSPHPSVAHIASRSVDVPQSNSTSSHSLPQPAVQAEEALSMLVTDNTQQNDHNAAAGVTSNVPAVNFTQSPVLTNEELATPLVQVPIVGYETIDRRTRFTVYKICVKRKTDDRQWFIFRRYADFCRLNQKLRAMFTDLHFPFPPKRWLGNNFEPAFLRDRQIGLQKFINRIVNCQKTLSCIAVQQFFCFDEPPGPYDSLQESRAMCETLEEDMMSLRRHLVERDAEVARLEKELIWQKEEVDKLKESLQLQKSINQWRSSTEERSRPESGIVLSDAGTEPSAASTQRSSQTPQSSPPTLTSQPSCSAFNGDTSTPECQHTQMSECQHTGTPECQHLRPISTSTPSVDACTHATPALKSFV